eukprot:scaffold327856_cov54-Tisochrysis_lutea.AAC.2
MSGGMRNRRKIINGGRDKKNTTAGSPTMRYICTRPIRICLAFVADRIGGAMSSMSALAHDLTPVRSRVASPMLLRLSDEPRLKKPR